MGMPMLPSAICASASLRTVVEMRTRHDAQCDQERVSGQVAGSKRLAGTDTIDHRLRICRSLGGRQEAGPVQGEIEHACDERRAILSLHSSRAA